MLISLELCLRKVFYQHIIYFYHVHLGSSIGLNHNFPVSRWSYRFGISLCISVLYFVNDHLIVWINLDLDGSLLLINQQYVSDLWITFVVNHLDSYVDDGAFRMFVFFLVWWLETSTATIYKRIASFWSLCNQITGLRNISLTSILTLNTQLTYWISILGNLLRNRLSVLLPMLPALLQLILLLL